MLAGAVYIVGGSLLLWALSNKPETAVRAAQNDAGLLDQLNLRLYSANSPRTIWLFELHQIFSANFWQPIYLDYR